MFKKFIPRLYLHVSNTAFSEVIKPYFIKIMIYLFLEKSINTPIFFVSNCVT